MINRRHPPSIAIAVKQGRANFDWPDFRCIALPCGSRQMHEPLPQSATFVETFDLFLWHATSREKYAFHPSGSATLVRFRAASDAFAPIPPPERWRLENSPLEN